MARWPSRTIRSRLFLILIGGIGIVVAIAATVWRFNIEPALRLGVAKNRQEVARRAADQIEEFLAHRIRELAAAAELGRLWVDDAGQRKEATHRVLKLSPVLQEVSFIDAAGRERLRVSRTAFYTEADLRDLAGTPGFRRAIGGDVYTSEVYHAPTAEPFVTVAVPVRFTRREIVGVLSAEVNLKTLWSAISHIGVGQSGFGFVVDRHGTLIAHPDYSKVLLRTSMVEHHKVREFLADPQRDVDLGRIRRGPDGAPVIATFAMVSGPRWAVVVEEPVSTALAEVRGVERFSLLLVLASVVAFALSYRFSERIARPLRELQDGAERIARGDLTHTLAISTGDEIEALADQFNHMARRLHQSHAALEAQIEEKTRDLSALYAVTTPISRATDLRAVLADAVARILEVTPADAAAIQLLDEGSAGATRGFPAPPDLTPVLDRWARLPDTAGPMIVPCLAEDSGPASRGLACAGFQCAAWLPLKMPERVIGAIILASGGAGRLVPEQQELFAVIAHQISVAVQNARLYNEARRTLVENQALFEESQQRLREMTVLHEISRALSSLADVREAYGRITHRVADLVGARRALIAVWDAGRKRLVAQGPGYGVSDELIRDFDRVVPLARGVGSLRERRSQILNDLGVFPLPPPIRSFQERHGFGCVAAVALRAEDRIVGALYVADKPGGFTGGDVRLLEVFADQAAIVLENNRLYAEARRALADLEAKNAELDSFVYSVSHDLKAPLVTLHGMAGVLLEDYGPRLGADGERYLLRVQANVQGMERLISDLLVLSRIGREGKPEEAVTLLAVIDDVLADMAGLVEDRGAKIVIQGDAVLRGIRTQIEQVLGNLIGNAIKYAGQEPPTIEIGAVDRGEVVECHVRDDGIGIDPAYHAKIFEMFQRLGDVETEGTGIGLAIVKKIVEGVGDRVWVESAKGEGATFRFTWPKALLG